MPLNRNEFLALVYADLFGYPLTANEAKLWSINIKSGPSRKPQEVQVTDGLLTLKGREKLIEIRSERNRSSQEKYELAKNLSSKISKIPFVEAIFLTGSAAANNAPKDSDIDLMLITNPNTLWLTRLVVILLLKLERKYRTPNNISNQFCPNIFLDSNNLEIKDKNLYTAHEILQAQCLFDRGAAHRKWLKANVWTKKYLPNAYRFNLNNCGGKNSLKTERQALKILALPEIIAFALQYLYQLPKQTNERIGLKFAFFHPTNLSDTILHNFESKHRALLYN